MCVNESVRACVRECVVRRRPCLYLSPALSIRVSACVAAAFGRPACPDLGHRSGVSRLIYTCKHPGRSAGLNGKRIMMNGAQQQQSE